LKLMTFQIKNNPIAKLQGDQEQINTNGTKQN
jgi:hypothetical protein